jgi:hypothetical protein
VVEDVQQWLHRASTSDPLALLEARTADAWSAEEGLPERLRKAAFQNFSARAVAHHFTELAARLFARQVAQVASPTPAGLYDALRHTLLGHWVVTRRQPPPTAWPELTGLVPDEFQGTLTEWFGNAVPPTDPILPDELRTWMLDTLRDDLERAPGLNEALTETDGLDALFRDVVLNMKVLP